MQTKKAHGRIIRISEFCYFALLVVWLFLPLIPGTKDSLRPDLLGSQLGAAGFRGILLAIGVWLVPTVAIGKVALFFFEGRPWMPAILARRGPLALLLGFLVSGVVVGIYVRHLFVFASSAAFFASIDPFSYAVLLLSIAYNAYASMSLIRSVGVAGVSREDLLAFKKEHASSSDKIRYAGIQRRLFISFLSLIVVVIVAICAVLLSDFSRTLHSSIIATGESIVDRTASMAKSNPGEGKDHISRDDYLRDEAGKNAKAIFPFESLSYYRFDSKASIFVAMESTRQSIVGTSMAESSVSFGETGWKERPEAERIDFFSPVKLSGKTLGLVFAEYDRDILYGPYFRTQAKVFVVALFFIYLSIFVTYLLGRLIVMPLLFLNMNVNRISQTLSGMISGRIKISAELINYEDLIRTKDEIKGLSVEIRGMTTVIRGVLPYISASTFKSVHSESHTTESRDLAFLFTDIRGFTTICEGRSPEEVVKLLNHYLELQSSLILENGGDIDKFVGDEIMAMFEGPQKELNACRAGLAIREAMAKEKELAQKAKRNVVAIGIGINAGPVVFGSVGAQNRMDFTSIGDTVNLAARLEGVNKEYGTKALITETVHKKVRADFLCREIDLITVKGKTEPVRIYEILQARSGGKSPMAALAASFEEGLAAYRAQNWMLAVERFKKLAEEYKDEASSVFLNRIAMFKSNPPPEDWDGVFALKTK
jgi:adenylate cyclase